MGKQVTNHIVEVVDLVKRYKKASKNAVDGVSFYVEEGSFFSLLGPNGAGKTTTISILTTILSKTSGQVSLAGYDVETESEKVRQKIGVIFQNPSLDINLTAEENVRFHANLYGLYKYRPSFGLMDKRYQEQVKELAEVVGLSGDIYKSVKSLSGGMKRKLEIIRSLMHSPKVLFLDEPTTGLDPISRANLWEYLQKIQKQNKITIFLTTHYLEEAEKSDYVCVINHGKLVAKGTVDEIKEELVEHKMIVDAANRKGLKAELVKLKLRISGSGPFTINLDGRSGQQIIQSIRSPLSVLDISKPTLEEAYVKIINNTNDG